LWLLVGSTNQLTVVIYFKKFNFVRLGLSWQPGGHYILQPFALFIYLFLIYFLIFQSWISETAVDSSAELSQQVVWGAGTSLSQSPKIPLGGARVKKGP